jgi:hypothetical protein
MHARYYNPAIGHFMSPDTVLPNPGDSCSYDRYAYCRNNPINLADPTGHFAWWVGAIIGAFVGGAVAAATHQNIFLGALTGAISGALFGLAGGKLINLIAAGAVSGTINAVVYGGNVMQGAILGAAGAAVGYGLSHSPAAAWLASKHCGGAVAVLSGGIVGGLTSVAMGGDFWRGFAYSGASAGLSYAASEVAGAIGTAAESGGVSLGPEEGNESSNGIPLGDLKRGDSALIVQLPDDPLHPEIDPATGRVIRTNPIGASASILASKLATKGLDVVLWQDANDASEIMGVLLHVKGDYDHIIVMGHNYREGMYLGPNQLWTQAQVQQWGGSAGYIANKSFIWNTCSAGYWNRSNYMAGPQLAPTVVASPYIVYTSISTAYRPSGFIGPPVFQASFTSPLWWWRTP